MCGCMYVYIYIFKIFTFQTTDNKKENSLLNLQNLFTLSKPLHYKN